MDREGEGVAARLPGDAEIGAGAAPFRAVRRDPTVTGAEMGQEVGEFVSEGAVDLRRAVWPKPAIQEDASGLVFRAAGSTAEPRGPFHPDDPGQRRGVISIEQIQRPRLQLRVAA